MPIVKEKGLADVASKAGNSVGKVGSVAANGGAAMHCSELTNM